MKLINLLISLKTSPLFKYIGGILQYNGEVFQKFQKFKILIGILSFFLSARVVSNKGQF